MASPSTRRWGRLDTGPRGERGATTLEFVIVLTALLMLIFGIMDFSRCLYTYHFVSEVCREGTRYAVVRGATFTGTSCASTITVACDATSTDVQTYVQALTPLAITKSSLTVTTSWPGKNPGSGAATAPACSGTNPSNSPGCYVQVTVSYPFHFMLPFLPSSATTYTFSNTSQMVIAQ